MRGEDIQRGDIVEKGEVLEGQGPRHYKDDAL